MTSLWDYSVQVEASKLSRIPSSLSMEGEIFKGTQRVVNSGDTVSDRAGNKHSGEVEAFLDGRISTYMEHDAFFTLNIGDSETRKKRSKHGANVVKYRFKGKL